jgi:putative ABC transport system permease protein
MTSFRKDDTSKPWCTVVGVIKDIKSDGLDQSGATHIYRPMYQFPGHRALSLGLMVRTSLSATSAEPLIRREIQTVDPNLPIFNVRTMNEVIDGSLALRRFSAELVGVFAVVALLLASVGIYGLLAYMVGQRAQESGVRIALGAQRNNILKLVLAQGALLAGVGICVGLILAAVAAPMIAALLYGIRAHDPIVFLAVPLILLGVSFAASYIPARRAARISPIVALREG